MGEGQLGCYGCRIPRLKVTVVLVLHDMLGTERLFDAYRAINLSITTVVYKDFVPAILFVRVIGNTQF